MLDQVINGLVLGNIYVLLAVGMALIFSVANLVNFSKGSVFMIGAYVGWALISQLGWPLWAALLAAALGCGLLGVLIERVAVEAAIEDVMTTVRQALEQQPHRVAPMLVGQDLDYIRATLKQETAAVLGEMVHNFAKRLRVLAGEEETA